MRQLTRAHSAATSRKNEFLHLGNKHLLDADNHAEKGNTKLACAVYLGAIINFIKMKNITKVEVERTAIESLILEVEERLYKSLKKIGRANLIESLREGIKSGNENVVAFVSILTIGITAAD